MLGVALDPLRAYGAPIACGVVRAEPEDFLVEEQLGFSPSGSGQHVLLKVRKRDANTQWVARELARACACRALDVGYAGLKDRHAVAIQWFTVPQSRISLEEWTAVRGQGFEVLEAHAHTRKLPRGALEGNRFQIRIRGVEVDEQTLATRPADIAAHGVPNYFGPQRFGHGGANLERMSEDPRALAPQQRSFMLSAARSLVFNAVAEERVADGSWATLEAGDIANLDGRGSVFAVEPDPSLLERCGRLELHPTGPLWGRGALTSAHRIHSLERAVSARFSKACALTEQAGMEQERRALRLAVRDLQWQRDQAGILIRFGLTRSGFATTVLREIVDYGANST
jgi:tRNA pseudouridine13 synthase